MPRIAFLTVVPLHAPFGDPIVQGFVDRLPSVFGEAEGSPGFIERSVRNYDSYVHGWGEYEMPAQYAVIPIRQLAITLSLWTDLESVAAFAYSGLHGEAMKLRREWFQETSHPTYAAWWVADDKTPTLTEAMARFDDLDHNGPNPQTFNFKSPFDANGEPVSLDREAIRRITSSR